MILVSIYEKRNNKVRLIKWQCPFIFVNKITSKDLISKLNIDPRCEFILTKEDVSIPINKNKLKYGHYYLTFYHELPKGHNNFIKEQFQKLPRLFEYPLTKGARFCIDNVDGKLREAYVSDDQKQIKLRWIECNCDPLEFHDCEDNPWLILKNWISLNEKRSINYKEEGNNCSLTVITENKDVYIVSSRMEDSNEDTDGYKLNLASDMLIDLNIYQK